MPVAERREGYEKRALVFNQGLRHMKVKHPSSEIYWPEFEMDGSQARNENSISKAKESRAQAKRNVEQKKKAMT
jgi:hypothetical protein